MTDASHDAKNTTAHWIVFIGTLIWTVLGILDIMPALLAVMMFDAPGSETNTATIVLVGSIMSFPLICCLSVVLSQLLRWRNRLTAACCFTLLPLLNLVIGSCALFWISTFQGGRFTN